MLQGVFTTQGGLKSAVGEWLNDPAAAALKHGDIGGCKCAHWGGSGKSSRGFACPGFFFLAALFSVTTYPWVCMGLGACMPPVPLRHALCGTLAAVLASL